jgi:nitrous oxide reductase accessory protein NosL
MSAIRALAAAMTGLLLSGCAVSSGGPPAIRYGASACAECRMLINEARFAATAKTTADDAVAFDSTECLVRYLHRGGPPLTQTWVHDYHAERWLTAEEAFYVASSELATPMGQGIVATATADAASRLAGTVHGRVLRFAQLAALVEQRTTSDETRSP